jgi:RNA polymerase sigma-70 factor (ECF subfamily)
VTIGKIQIDQILHRISRSDETAFRALVEYYHPRLLQYAYVILKSNEDAEDIVLEVLQGVWDRRQKIAEIERFDSYLYISVRNLALDHHRKNSRLLKVREDEPLYREHITHHNPEQSYLDRELVEIIDGVVLGLPEKTRLVYRLVKEEGLKYQEAADMMGTSVKTVNNQLLTAMKAIRKAVQAYLADDNDVSVFRVIRSLGLWLAMATGIFFGNTF